MDCELCRKDIGDVIVLLPIKKPDGRLSILTCLECAKKSSAYCQKHERPHIGFAGDNTTACLICVEEEVGRRKLEADSIFDRIKEVLSQEELEDLSGWVRVSSFITGDSEAVSILRAIATRAARFQISIDEVVEQILKAKSLDIILPRCLI